MFLIVHISLLLFENIFVILSSWFVKDMKSTFRNINWATYAII